MAYEHHSRTGATRAHRSHHIARRSIGRQRRDDLHSHCHCQLQRADDELRRLHRARERARPYVRRRAVMPAQAISKTARLLPPARREVAVRIAQLQSLIDGRGVPDQEDLHDRAIHRLHPRWREYRAPMKLYGTTTSPFVRRVRIVAAEINEPFDRIETATDEGQAALRAISPIRKVPVAVIDGRTIYDSHTIIEYLTLTRGYGALEPPRDRWREHNLVNAVDAALDAVIQLFYLRRDGVAIAGTPYE